MLLSQEDEIEARVLMIRVSWALGQGGDGQRKSPGEEAVWTTEAGASDTSLPEEFWPRILAVSRWWFSKTPGLQNMLFLKPATYWSK